MKGRKRRWEGKGKKRRNFDLTGLVSSDKYDHPMNIYAVSVIYK